MFGPGSVFFGGIPYNGGSTVPFKGAFNGTSVDPVTGKVELGSAYGSPALGELTYYQEIDLQGFNLFFDIVSNSLDASGRFEAFAIGINSFTNIGGTTLNISYSNFPVGTYGMIGHTLATEDANTTMSWFREINNAGFVFGDIFSNASSNLAPRLLFWDSGNVTLNSEPGNYPGSNDVDTGFTFGLFGIFIVLDPSDSGANFNIQTEAGGLGYRYKAIPLTLLPAL